MEHLARDANKPPELTLGTTTQAAGKSLPHGAQSDALWRTVCLMGRGVQAARRGHRGPHLWEVVSLAAMHRKVAEVQQAAAAQGPEMA